MAEGALSGPPAMPAGYPGAMTHTPRPRPPLATSVGIALAGGALFIAGIVATWGLVSLATDRDVIADSSVTPVLVPAATGLTAVAVALVLLGFIARRWPAHSVATRLGYGAVLGVIALVVWIAALVVGHFLGGADPAAAMRFGLHQLFGAFAWSLAAVAAIVGALMLAWTGYWDPDKPPPRWRWESRDDED